MSQEKYVLESAEYGDGNFPFGFGTKMHLERNQTGLINLGLHGLSNQRWNSATTVLGEKVPVGFRPAHNTHFRAYAVENGKTNGNAYIDFILHKNGKIEAFSTGMDKVGVKFELLGGVVYPVLWEDSRK